MRGLGSLGVAYLEWESTSPENQRDRVKVALHADEMWDEVLQKLPDGIVVMNEPLGAVKGDYARADVYSRAGFGVMQQDGMQYGIIDHGGITPFNPFIADEGHLKQMADRAHAAGVADLETSINEALVRRDNNHIYDQQNQKFVYDPNQYGKYYEG